MTDPHRSPLHDTLESLGAQFAPVESCLLAERFTSVEEECRAVRETVGIFDRSGRGFLAATGPDAARFLHGMVTNLVQELNPSEGNYSCHLNTQGHIIADFHLLAMPDHFLLETNSSLAEPLRASLEKYIIADDVELSDFRDKLSALSVQGPEAGKLLTAAGASSLPAAEYGHAWTDLDETPVLIVKLSETGEEGFRLIFVPANAERIWQALTANQDEVPWRPAGHAALNVLRTEAGIPWYGAELTEQTLPPEARIEQRAINYDKGCYLGQEIIERIRSRGNVNRLLTGFFLEADTLPAPGTKLRKDDKNVGWITTAVHSPTLGRNIALGYLRRKHTAPENQLTLAGGGTAKVTQLPFLR